MIPKLIHQTYKTGDIPHKWLKYQQTVRDLHPGWTYKLWTDEDNLQFVKTEFPDFLDTFVALPKNIMRADVIRYLLLYRLGGLYLDLDYEMLKTFDMLDHEVVLPWEGRPDTEGAKDKVSNAVMAASPGNAFFRIVIEELKKNPPRSPEADVEESTGPGFLTRIISQVSKEQVSIFAPPRPYFGVLTPRSPRQYRAIVREGVAYGIHHSHGSWRELSLFVRIRHRVGSFLKWFT